MLVHGRATDEVDERGRPVYGETLLLLLNGGWRSRVFTLPGVERPGLWEEMLNTARAGSRLVRKPTVNLTAHSVILLRYAES
jgi:glycogen operon protein